MRSALLAALLFLAPLAFGQDSIPAPPVPPDPAAKPLPKPVAPKLSKSQMTAAELQKTVDTLTQSNHDLLDLLQKQQAVLEDMQFDRRLQSRQIQSLEERLEATLYDNNQLQNKVSKLETQISTGTALAGRDSGSIRAHQFGHVGPCATAAAFVVPARSAANRCAARHSLVAPALHAQGRRNETDRPLPDSRQDLARAVAQSRQTGQGLREHEPRFSSTRFPRTTRFRRKSARNSAPAATRPSCRGQEIII